MDASVDRRQLLLVGAGKMGGALLGGWLRADMNPGHITVLEADAGRHAALASLGVRCAGALDAAPDAPGCVVLAVKPQSLGGLLPQLAARYGASPLYLTVAAGKTLAFYERALGAGCAVIRAMPNTPALVRKAISALCANAAASDAQKHLAETLLQAVGETLWLENEAQMDAATALSGSGPAYVFLFLQALIAAGVKQGLGERVATRLALHTLRGSAKLALKSDEPLTQLRRNVTSPGGTTQAALAVLMQGDALGTLIDHAVDAAVKRAKELA